MPKSRAFTRAGRTILRDGVPILRIDRVGNDSQGYTLAPWEADGYAHMLCRMLNNRGTELVDAALAAYLKGD